MLTQNAKNFSLCYLALYMLYKQLIFHYSIHKQNQSLKGFS